jgi:predicted RNA binding protein YcfA (HicA-like mRNA interferase family)
MSPKLPVLSGDELVGVLQRFGYAVVRQKGSHIRLRHATDSQRKPLTVPRHKALKPGLLHRILRDANLSVDELTAHL